MSDRSQPVRVRVAPSPTGEVHIGTIWVAQFVWVFARQHHGAFVVRIEDTDRERLVPGSAERIFEALDWYGLTPDESPKHGGPFGPYVQSERLELYRQHAQQLIDKGSAYYCFCSEKWLEELRQQQIASKQAPRYDKRCLAIPRDEAARRVSAGESHVIRLNVPATGTAVIHDLIRGTVTFSFTEVDDSVLMKSDGFPTYHLAVVVDDHLMEISHVIRGEEWLPSAPKHLLLYQAFGWEPPRFAHMPMILGTDHKKLSKRSGATSALSFRDEGYLPEAMKNFLLLMGWRPKGDQEVFPMAVALEQFKLEDVNPSGAIFDRTKLEWMNGAYLRSLSEDALLERAAPFWKIPQEEHPSMEWKRQALGLVRDRMRTLSEVTELLDFGFSSVWDTRVKAFERDDLVPRKSSAEKARIELEWACALLEAFRNEWEAKSLKANVLAAIAEARKKNGDVLWPLRVALTLKRASPDVFDVLVLLGRGESIRRVKTFL